MGRSSACIAVLIFAAGCAGPEDPVVIDDVGAPAPDADFDLHQAYFAVLGAEQGGGWSIRLHDAVDEIARLDVDLTGPRGLVVHPDGFFLVRESNTIVRVEMDGSVHPFAPAELNYLHGMSVTPDGHVVVAAESEVWELDPYGTPTGYAETADDYCWMDVAAGNAGSIVVDLWGSTIGTVDTEAGTVTDLIRLPETGLRFGVRAHDGTTWAASPDRSQAYVIRNDGEISAVQLDAEALAIAGLLPAGGGSILAAVHRSDGAALVQVSPEGLTEERVLEPGGLWIDVASIE